MISDGAIQTLFEFHPCIHCFVFKSTKDMYTNSIDQKTLSLSLTNLNLSLGNDIYSV